QARREGRPRTGRKCRNPRGSQRWRADRDQGQRHSEVRAAQERTGRISAAMLNKLLEFAVKQRLLVAAGALILIAFGIWAAVRLPIDAFPDVTNVQVQVISSAGGMSPPEVEQLVTIPIETEMGGLPRVREIRSVSRIGFSLVTVVFEDGVNDY